MKQKGGEYKQHNRSYPYHQCGYLYVCFLCYRYSPLFHIDVYKRQALAPILIVWLGNNIKTIIVAAISVAVFGCIMTLHTGFMQTDPDKIKLIYSLGGTKKDVLTKVLLPGSVPLIISNMKVNIGLCLVGVIIGEFLAANKGLGYLIIYGSQVDVYKRQVLPCLPACGRLYPDSTTALRP